MKPQKKNPPKKRRSKYQQPLSLYGVSETETLKDILKSPPMLKTDTKEKGE